MLRTGMMAFLATGLVVSAMWACRAAPVGAGEPLNVAPAVYRSDNVSGSEVTGGASVQLVRHWHGHGGYGWGGGYRGYGYGYRPYYGGYGYGGYGVGVGVYTPMPLYTPAPVVRYGYPVYSYPAYGYGYYGGCW